MAEYKLHISGKTSLLNKFRRFFMFPVTEKILLFIRRTLNLSFITRLIPPHYLYPENSIRRSFHRGSELELDISDMVDHYLFWKLDKNEYTPAEDAIRNARVIMDIGANIGSTALFFASLNSSGTIYAFEPNAGTFKKLRRNISLNRYANISVQNSGLGERRDTVKLYEVDDTNPGMNRILTHEENLPYTLIHIDTLDNFCTEKGITQIDFIKIDVEGYEYHVLSGGSNIIRKSRPVLFMELDDNNLKANNNSAFELISLLINFGYSTIFRTDTNQEITTGTDFKNCHYDIIARP
jgi:FkbM family methyltransferase